MFITNALIMALIDISNDNNGPGMDRLGTQYRRLYSYISYSTRYNTCTYWSNIWMKFSPFVSKFNEKSRKCMIVWDNIF